jgi:hypothetical protein
VLGPAEMGLLGLIFKAGREDRGYMGFNSWARMIMYFDLVLYINVIWLDFLVLLYN